LLSVFWPLYFLCVSGARFCGITVPGVVQCLLPNDGGQDGGTTCAAWLFQSLGDHKAPTIGALYIRPGQRPGDPNEPEPSPERAMS